MPGTALMGAGTAVLLARLKNDGVGVGSTSSAAKLTNSRTDSYPLGGGTKSGVRGAADGWLLQRQIERDIVAELGAFAGAAFRVAEGDQGRDGLLKRDVAADPTAHALASEYDRVCAVTARSAEATC